MKKILALLICITMIAVCFIGCDTTPAETKAPDNGTKAPASNNTTEAPGNDTTKAPAGTTAEPATSTTADPNALYEDEMELFTPMDDPSGHVAVNANNGKELACKFTIKEGDFLTGLTFGSMPTWSAPNTTGFTIALYNWTDDYETTMMADPIKVVTFTEWSDNDACEVNYYDEMGDGFTGFPAGNYLWVLQGAANDAGDQIGIWAEDCSDECIYFEDGTESFTAGYVVYATILTKG